jgi:hypothetical protein
MIAFAALAIRTGLATKPNAYSWRQATGAAALAGIGLTMSLFVAGQAMPTSRPPRVEFLRHRYSPPVLALQCFGDRQTDRIEGLSVPIRPFVHHSAYGKVGSKPSCGNAELNPEFTQVECQLLPQQPD